MPKRPAPSPGPVEVPAVGGLDNPPSPSANPAGFSKAIGSHFAGLASQLSSGRGFPGGGGGAYTTPDSGPLGGKRRRNQPDATADPGFNSPTGPQSFGTYAPGVNPDQFTSESFKRQGLRDSKLSDSGMGGMLGGFGGMGMGGGLGSIGAGFSGQGDPRAFVDMLMSLLGQLGQQGPLRGG